MELMYFRSPSIKHVLELIYTNLLSSKNNYNLFPATTMEPHKKYLTTILRTTELWESNMNTNLTCHHYLCGDEQGRVTVSFCHKGTPPKKTKAFSHPFCYNYLQFKPQVPLALYVMCYLQGELLLTTRSRRTTPLVNRNTPRLQILRVL